MEICLKCGFRRNPYWRNSRFDYNAEDMAEEDFKREFPEIWELLKDKKNHQPIEVLPYYYYRRGKSQRRVYRVLPEYFRVPRERKKHIHLQRIDKK